MTNEDAITLLYQQADKKTLFREFYILAASCLERRYDKDCRIRESCQITAWAAARECGDIAHTAWLCGKINKREEHPAYEVSQEIFKILDSARVCVFETHKLAGSEAANEAKREVMARLLFAR